MRVSPAVFACFTIRTTQQVCDAVRAAARKRGRRARFRTGLPWFYWALLPENRR